MFEMPRRKQAESTFRRAKSCLLLLRHKQCYVIFIHVILFLFFCVIYVHVNHLQQIPKLLSALTTEEPHKAHKSIGFITRLGFDRFL